MLESLEQQAIRELNAAECAVCKRPKQSGHSFCRACYFKLPKDKRQALYTPVSEGYANIYDDLKQELLGERRAAAGGGGLFR